MGLIEGRRVAPGPKEGDYFALLCPPLAQELKGAPLSGTLGGFRVSTDLFGSRKFPFE